MCSKVPHNMNELFKLKKRLLEEYRLYSKGSIDQYEYCMRIRPIDQAIDKLEMSTLQGTLDLKGSSLQHTPKLKH